MASNFIGTILPLAFMVIILVISRETMAQTPDLEYTIDEEIRPPTQIGDISQNLALFPGTTESDRRAFQYGIIGQASVPASLFNITRNGGVIYVAKRIDREELCFGLEECVLKITVLVTSSVPSQFKSQVILIFITILDINDNAPSFGKSSVSLEVSEGNAPNSTLKITGANDRDFLKAFKVKNYTLNGFRDVFELTASRALDGSSEIDLRLLKSLDRERQDRYQFTISAYDGGAPPLSARLFVDIDVTDKNDNAPIFMNSSYSVTIDSTTEVNSVILRVSAVDEDKGPNSEITFGFSSLQKLNLEETFHINSTTGEISVIGPLKAGVMLFIVEALDNGKPQLKSQTEVSVNVVSNGNLAPVVVIRTLGTVTEANTISILEPGGRGMFVALVDVDDDGGRENVVCKISSEVFRMESIPNKGYKISLQGSVDRETKDSYNLSVICTDRGNPPVNTTQHFLVKIQDANDNDPKFTQLKYSRTLAEGQKNGEYVLQVSATDKDIGDNGKIQYSIDPNFSSMFDIDSETGVITAIGDLDREQNGVLTFNVYAADFGDSQRQAFVKVSVILEDINDNVPKFTKKVYYFRAREEIKGQRIINDLKATDADVGLNGQLEYFFTGSMDGADGAFTVMTNGSIVSSHRLDREERANYTFSVMVRDRGSSPLMSSASVVIEITDINDNSPDILFPKSKNHTILISTVPETGVVLSRIIAYDDDEGENGSLKFTIVSGNEDKAFEIGDSSGELKISEASRLKNKKHYDVSIVVSDRGSPPRANTTSLKIDVFFDNITNEYLGGKKEKQEDYIVIVAVVAAITVVFSALIIVAICVVLHKDRISRRKSNSPKTVFHNLQTNDKSPNTQKIATRPSTVSETSSYPLGPKGNLHGHHPPPSSAGGPHHNSDKGPYFQERFTFSDGPNNSVKGKAVSFSLEDGTSKSPPPPPSQQHQQLNQLSSSPRSQTPPLSTFSSGHHRVRPSEDNLFHQRLLMPRQVSGAKYTPVSTCVHGDDVRSDTSADTNTSDSGRGNSVDDVNFEQVMRDDLSPKLALPPRQPITSLDVPDRSSTRVRFNEPEHKTDRDKMADAHRKSFSNHYGGGRSVSSNIVPPKKHAFPEFTHSHSASSRQMPAGKGSGGHNNINNLVPSSTNNKSPSSSKFSTFSSQHHASVTSLDDDASTTTSGSYVINPDEVKLETYVGSDIVV